MLTDYDEYVNKMNRHCTEILQKQIGKQYDGKIVTSVDYITNSMELKGLDGRIITVFLKVNWFKMNNKIYYLK